jgi:low temperature requirement protein LtrA
VAESSEHSDAPERIEWLELFFDLVVVAAVAVMSDALRETRRGAGSASSR